MKRILIAILLVFFILPTSAWAQYNQPSATLTVEVLSPYSYKADDGSTVVLGEVENKNNFPVTGVKIGVSFYDETGKMTEYKTGTTLIKVIPAKGKAPFSISSTKPGEITDISVNLTGFNSSPARPQVLNLSPDILEISEDLTLSGTIINGGTIPTTGTTIHLISYDAFGRVVGIASTTPDPEDVDVGKTSVFSITTAPKEIARSYKIVAESDNYQSTTVDVKNVKTTISSLTKLVTINDVSVTDLIGNKYSTIPVGSTVKIASEIWIKYADEQSEQPYVYYVQIKQIETEKLAQDEDVVAPVEFIGIVPGVFHGIEKQDVSVNWIPDKQGAFFVEVYVWDQNAVALASPSSMINVMLVK
ncbi:MAG TPA: FxLYD domain-containing protein [Nitrosopumilaceae archaeon]|nr:FxLYD domain-containing protein [Nitrosopumilaceae archaeon]